MKHPDSDEDGDVELGCNGREEGEDGRGEETESVNSFDSVHLSQSASDDLCRHVSVTVFTSERFFMTSPVFFISFVNKQFVLANKL